MEKVRREHEHMRLTDMEGEPAESHEPAPSGGQSHAPRPQIARGGRTRRAPFPLPRRRLAHRPTCSTPWRHSRPSWRKFRNSWLACARTWTISGRSCDRPFYQVVAAPRRFSLEQQSNSNAGRPDLPPLRVFVYGTLKRGGRNHDAYCRGLIVAQPARVLGRLYHLPAGYPMLAVPDTAVLAHGSSDYAADAARLADPLLPATPIITAPHEWILIDGELLHIDHPATRMPALDRLEDFVPSGPSSTGACWSDWRNRRA